MIEIPVVYGVAASSGRKGDQKDVIDLALRAAWIAGRAYERGNCPSIFYTPAGWKGGMDKATSHAHIACALTESELAKVVLPRSKERQLDVWDAIGVGAHHLHRLPWRRPVPPARL